MFVNRSHIVLPHKNISSEHIEDPTICKHILGILSNPNDKDNNVKG